MVFAETKLPATVNGSPYTNSADYTCKSSLGVVRMPNKTHGSSSIQCGPDTLIFSQAFMVFWIEGCCAM